MRRANLAFAATLAVWSAVACAEVMPTSPLESDDEKEEFRELVEKVKALAVGTAAGEEKDPDMVFAPGELDGYDEADAGELGTAEVGMALLAASGSLANVPESEPVIQVKVVRCAPEMLLERPRAGGVVVVVAAGRTRGVIDEER